MSSEVPLLMPKMSMTMETGELLSWEVEQGATVQAGDVVAVVQTDKVDMEVESPCDGTVERFVAEPGSTVDVGAPIAFLTTESDSLMSGLFDEPDVEPSALPAEPIPEAATHARGERELVASAPSRGGPLPAVPKARRRAAQLRILLTDVTPSGPNGVITVGDVERAAKSGSPQGDTKAEPRVEPKTEPKVEPKTEPTAPGGDGPGFADALAARRRSIRSAVARTMTRSAAVPQFTAFADLDLEALQQARGEYSWTTVLVRALARALRAHPSVLAGWDEQAEAPAPVPDSCGVALAVDTAVGLLAPVVRDADHAPLRELHASVRDVIARARDGKLTSADLQGASTTLSSLGGMGVPSFTSLLTPPQASALSVGAIAPKPVVHHGGLAVRLSVTVGLTVDHRAVDGADAAAVLEELRTLCAHPGKLLE